MKSLLEDITAIGGVSAITAIFGGVFGWAAGKAKGKDVREAKAAETDAKLRDTVNEAVEDLIGNLRTDCADARRDAGEAKAEVASCREEHEHCRTELAEVKRLREEDRALIDHLMAQQGHTEPVELPRPVPGQRKPRVRKAKTEGAS